MTDGGIKRTTQYMNACACPPAFHLDTPVENRPPRVACRSLVRHPLDKNKARGISINRCRERPTATLLLDVFHCFFAFHIKFNLLHQKNASTKTMGGPESNSVHLLPCVPRPLLALLKRELEVHYVVQNMSCNAHMSGGPEMKPPTDDESFVPF